MIKRALWVAPLLLAIAATAKAQLAPGVSGISDMPTTATEDQYWFFVRELGRCLVRTKRDHSIAFLGAEAGSPAETRAYRALIKQRGANTCMSNMVSAPIIRGQLRGSVAEALYEAHISSAPQQPAPQGLSAPAAVRSIYDFADCYVAGNYMAARRLLADTKLGTAEESRQIRDMASSFGPCLPQGREVRIVPMDARLALAEALYRTTVSRPAAGQGTN